MTETTKELLNDVKETAKTISNNTRERLSSPLLGPFITALIAYNWRPITLLLFSEKTIDCKIAVIDEKYSGLDGIFWPIGIAFIYYVAIPVIMAGCETILLPIEKIRIWIKYNRLGKEAKEEKDYQAVRSGNKEVEALNNEVKNLKDEMALMIDTHDATIQRYIKQIDDLNKASRNSSRGIINLTKPGAKNHEKFNPILEKLDNNFIIELHDLQDNFNGTDLPKRTYDFLKSNNFIVSDVKGISFTKDGSDFLKYINSNFAVFSRNN
jgi:hypothetical protein